VTLVATPQPGFSFVGWMGGECYGTAPCTLQISSSVTVKAVFKPWGGTKIGVFRPSTHQWFLDLDGDGRLTSCTRDACLQFQVRGNFPVVGDWTGTGTVKIGLYEMNSGQWFLDGNGNNYWDGCGVDICFGSFGSFPRNTVKLPVVGKWRAGQQDNIGIFQSRGIVNIWRLDIDGDGAFDNCATEDDCAAFGMGSLWPIVGDWTGTGMTQLGLFNPLWGFWKLDLNGNRRFDNCSVDACLGPFGVTDDFPVAGDWNDDGKTEIGVFDQSTGLWELDFDGNGTFDGCDVDRCLGPFGQEGDIPVVGKW